MPETKKPIDLMVWETREKILDILKQSGLPITSIAYITQNVYEIAMNEQNNYFKSLNIRKLQPLPEKGAK